MEDPVVLSFYDTLLHQSDVELLRGPHWLNDSIISFYFEYMENVAYRNNDKLLFVGPEVTQCLKISSWKDLEVFLEPLKLKDRHFCFFALNDNEVTEKPGGTHWSLLIYSKPENTFSHFDSSSGCNFEQAWKLASNLSKYLSMEIDFMEVDTLQQSNGYDCGIHLLCNVDQLAQYCSRNNKINGVTPIKQVMVIAKRTEVHKLIESLRRKQNQR